MQLLFNYFALFKRSILQNYASKFRRFLLFIVFKFDSSWTCLNIDEIVLRDNRGTLRSIRITRLAKITIIYRDWLRSFKLEKGQLFKLHRREGLKAFTEVHKMPRYLLIYYKTSFIMCPVWLCVRKWICVEGKAKHSEYKCPVNWWEWNQAV